MQRKILKKADIKLLSNFQIAETETFQEHINSNEFKKIYKKIQEYIYPQLKINPYFGNNIKRLKGEYNDTFRYRIGKYRLFYSIDESKVIIYVIDIIDRKDAYKNK